MIEKTLIALFEQLTETAKANLVIGEEIVIGSVSVIPVSKVSFSYAVGGKGDPEVGGSGGVVSVEPVGFLVVSGNDVRFIRVKEAKSWIDLISESDIPSKIERVLSSLGKKGSSGLKGGEGKSTNIEEEG